MELLIAKDEAELWRSALGFFTREGHVLESADMFREWRTVLHSLLWEIFIRRKRG